MLDRSYSPRILEALMSDFAVAPRSLHRVSTGRPAGTLVGGYLYLTHGGVRRAGLDVAYVLHFKRAPRAAVRALDRDPLNFAADNLCDVPGVRKAGRGAVCARVDLMTPAELADALLLLSVAVDYDPLTGAIGWQLDPGMPFRDAVRYNNNSPIINVLGYRFRAQDVAWLKHRGTQPRCPVRSFGRTGEGRPDLRACMLGDGGTPVQYVDYLARTALAASARNAARAAAREADALTPRVVHVAADQLLEAFPSDTPDDLPDLF